METLTKADAILYLGIAIITGIFAPLIVVWFRNWLRSRIKKSNPIKQALVISNHIEEQLGIILDELDCNGVWVAQFHNGGKFFPTGKSIQKFSIFYEKTTPGLEPIQQIFQEIPCSLFTQALSKIYQNGHLSIQDYKQENTFDLDSLLKSSKAKSFYMYGLYDLEERLIGVLSLSYSKKHVLDLDEIDFINTKLGVIGTLLGEYLTSK